MKTTHTDQILDALHRGESITPLEALQRFGCLRLGARIWDLRRAGHPVISETVDPGNGKHVSRYFFDSDYLAAKRAHAVIVDESQERPEFPLAR